MVRHLHVLLLIAALAPSIVHAQAYDHRIIYCRETQPTGAVWLNDGVGTDSLLFTNGNLAKVDRSGSFIMYMQNTPVNNAAYSGNWVRHDGSDGTDHVLYNNNDYIAGYDMLGTDSSYVMSYGCGLYRYSFDGTYISTIANASCYDDAPDIRPSDSLVVFHNSQASMFTVGFDGSDRIQLPNTTSVDYWPTWSPDGQWILFGRYTNVGPVNFYRIKEDGDSLTALTLNDPLDTAHYSSNAVWGPDGSTIITAGYRSNGTYGLMEIEADGSGVEHSIATTPGDRISFVSGAANAGPQTSVHENPNAEALRLWPVPTNDAVTLDLPSSTSAWSLRILDAQGRSVRILDAHNGRNDLDLSLLPAGLYYLRATTIAGRTLSAPLVKM